MLAAAALAAAAACMREASDLDQHRRYAGTDRWTVNGVRPGDAGAAVIERIGPPDRTTSSMGKTVHEWTSRRQLAIVVDPDGTVSDLTGGNVEAGGKPIVWSGLEQPEVERILGKGRVQRVRQPGSGVISVGLGKVTGTILTYDDQGVRFEIQLDEVMVKRVRAFRPPAR